MSTNVGSICRQPISVGEQILPQSPFNHLYKYIWKAAETRFLIFFLLKSASHRTIMFFSFVYSFRLEWMMYFHSIQTTLTPSHRRNLLQGWFFGYRSNLERRFLLYCGNLLLFGTIVAFFLLMLESCDAVEIIVVIFVPGEGCDTHEWDVCVNIDRIKENIA